MNVENHWRQLKHDYLHRVARPRLDHLVWVLINQVTPAYVARAEILDDGYRMGRSKQLTTYQKYFKKSWKVLLECGVSEKKYSTSLRDFSCTCGRQKYDTHLLCKHLVQIVGLPSSHFWEQVIHQLTVPFYCHTELKPKNQRENVTCDDNLLGLLDGGIAGGDDHEWAGDVDALRGGGGWKQLMERKGEPITTGISSLSKRKRRDAETHTSDSEPPAKSMRTHEVIDLTASSPTPEDTEMISEEVRSSSPIEYGAEDENQVNLL
ncbi:hypothetical protein H0H87_006272 [Tephrocybe sp. NHM501043]|nr:hypothetical protein H0H87_006272 [Tephrocybe sp. NHM501043]